MANSFLDEEDLQYNLPQQTANNSFLDAEDLQYNLPQQKTTQPKPKPQQQRPQNTITQKPQANKKQVAFNPQYADILSDNSLTKEQKAEQIKQRGEQERANIEADKRKNINRIRGGAVVQASSGLPIFNIPFVGTGIGGALFDVGQGIMEGDKLPDLAKRAGQGFIVGETIGAIPYVGKAAAKTKAGQAVVKRVASSKVAQATGKAIEKAANSKIGQELTKERQLRPSTVQNENIVNPAVNNTVETPIQETVNEAKSIVPETKYTDEFIEQGIKDRQEFQEELAKTIKRIDSGNYTKQDISDLNMFINEIENEAADGNNALVVKELRAKYKDLPLEDYTTYMNRVEGDNVDYNISEFYNNLKPTRNIDMPDTIYNEQTAKTAQKGIQKEIGDMIEKPQALDYVNRHYKNRFYKVDMSTPEIAAMHEGDIEINKILKEIKDNPNIINDPEKLAELESRIPQFEGYGLEDLTEQYYNKFYQAVDKAADYNKVGQDLNLSNAAREAGEIKQSRLAATADNPKEIEQISKELEKKGRLPEYEVLHNADLKAQAKELVDKDLYKTYSSLTNKVTEQNAELSALDFETARQTIEKLYKEGTDEAIENANKLTIEISKKATEAGQAVQALSLWHKTTPSGAVKAAEKLISEYNTKHPKTPLKLTKEKTKEIIAQAEKIQQQKLLNPDEYMDRKAIVEAAKLKKSIYSVVPKSAWEKNMGFRYINMLLSPKSRIKDFVLTGVNTADTAADELIANYLIDTPRALFTKSKKVFNGLHPKAWASGIKKGFKEGIEDVREGINTSRGGEVGRYGVANTTFNYKPLSQVDTTGLNPLQKAGRYISQGFENAMVPLEKSLQYSLQVPDRMFYEGRYASSLIDQMKAAGVNAPTDAMKKRAVEEARRAVYQENRPITDFMLNMVKDQDNPVAQMAKYQIPFIKTPTNITAQGLEGLHGLFTGSNKLRNAMTPEQIREAELLMARGIKGLGELGLGAGIGKGLYNTYTNIGNNNYEENEITGLKPQSVAKGDKAISLQNYQQALPVFTGVGLIKGGLGGAVDATANAIMDMPALKALGDINRISKQTQYIAKNADDSDYLARKGGEIARSLGTNAITSEIPLSGLLGELRNDIDPYSREMRVPNDGTLQSTGQYIGNRILNRLPFASRLLPQKYNAVGQPAMINNINNPFARVLSEAIDLGVRNYTPNETYNYLKNVNDMANKLDLEGKTGTALTKAKKKIKINGEDVQLNNKQYSEYQRIYGQLRTNLTQELINSGKYNNLDPQLTTTDINDVRKSADEAAKYLLFGNELKKKPNRYTQYLINNLSNYLTQEE